MNNFRWLFLFVIYALARLFYIVGAFIIIAFIMTYVADHMPKLYALPTAVFIVVWLGWVSYVGHQQLMFSFVNLLSKFDITKE